MLQITKASHNRLALSLKDKPLTVCCQTYLDAKHYRQAAKLTGLDAEYLAECVSKYRETGEAAFPLPVSPGDVFTVTVRSRTGGNDTVHSGPDARSAFAAALAAESLPTEPVITWKQCDQIAALDIDWHEGKPPDNAAGLLDAVQPVPAYSWVTHGGGLRLVYFAGSYPAPEYAAAAALAMQRLNGSHRAEIVTTTRHPAGLRDGKTCGPVSVRTQGTDVSGMLSYFTERTAADEDVAEWLSSRGLTPGARYPHAQCPVSPSDKGQGDPVTVSSDGVYCHYCHAMGVTHGARVPGFFPFGSFVAGRLGRLAACVRGFVHWEHAELIISEQLTLSPALLRQAYRAALRMHHGDDPRCDRVFTSGVDLLRYTGWWGTRNGEPMRSSGIDGILSELPACQLPDGKPSAERVNRFAQPISLEPFGYLPVQPVFGVRLGEPSTAAVAVVTPTGPLASGENARLRPRYIRSPEERMCEEQAWRKLEEVTPELPRQYVKLLIAGKMAVDHGSPMPPFIYAHGPSGASKTGSVQVAAGILGDVASEVSYDPADERLRQGVMEGKRRGTFCVFNEILKGIKSAKLSPVQGMNALLGLTPDSYSHMLYIGQVPLGRVPVVVWTDTSLPAEIRWDRQLARRLVEVRLPGELNWVPSMRAAGVSHLGHLRTQLPGLCHALDSILSHTADWAEGKLFSDAANELGYSRLDQQQGEEETLLRDFFTAVCKAPAPQERTARRLGPGWKVIGREEDTDLSGLWCQLADTDDWRQSRRVTAADLRRITGAVCEFESKEASNGVAVRFFRKLSHKQFLYNGEVAADGIGQPVS